jgi:hypothetical protein
VVWRGSKERPINDHTAEWVVENFKMRLNNYKPLDVEEA